jgi:hypothetical protein
MKRRTPFVIVSFLCAMVCTIAAQTVPIDRSPEASQVPRLIRFSGIAKDDAGRPLSGPLGVTFMLYRDQQGGSPLWMETQNVQADATGHYTALLGSASADGVPLELFSSAEVHWITAQISGQPEQARLPLFSVPYALKAVDAETLGGLPASAFVQSNPGATPAPATGAKANATPTSGNAASPAAITGSGTTDFIPLWTTSSNLGNSVLFQTGGKVGLGTQTPSASLDAVGAAVTIRGRSSGATGTGVFGAATATTGVNFGVQGTAVSTSGVGVSGSAPSSGVDGTATATTGVATGVYGQISSPLGNGVAGFALATSGSTAGVFGQNASTSGVGVSGSATATTGQVSGVYGTTNSTTANAAGVNGYEGATAGQVYGVNGNTNSTGPAAAGVNGYEGATTGSVYGVSGTVASTNGTGVWGYASAATGFTVGVFGQSASSGGVGVVGKTVTAGGTAGQFVNYAGSGLILQGQSGSSFQQVFSVDASGNGTFAGNLNVTGKVTKGSGSFKIDHPLDPANKYLSHSFVESPDMMNVYNGNVTTDGHGTAVVVLPDYFEALNRDFRYQLTVIGQFAQAIVKREIKNNRFTIKTNKPSVKVSWQVTGIRHDAYADSYRIAVEENKPAAEQGYYLHPELFGQPESKSIAAAQRPSSAPESVAANLSHQ